MAVTVDSVRTIRHGTLMINLQLVAHFQQCILGARKIDPLQLLEVPKMFQAHVGQSAVTHIDCRKGCAFAIQVIQAISPQNLVRKNSRCVTIALGSLYRVQQTL